VILLAIQQDRQHRQGACGNNCSQGGCHWFAIDYPSWNDRNLGKGVVIRVDFDGFSWSRSP
jgi:hypothetical protein